MIRVFALLPKRRDMTVEQFHAHWRGPHAELGKRNKAMSRYVQSHRLYDIATPFRSAPYNGVAEGWFADIAAAQSMGSDPDYLEYAAKDEPRFIEMEGLTFMFAEETVTLEGPGRDGVTVKLIQLVAGHAEVQRDALVERLIDTDHAEVERLGIVRRVVSAVVGVDSEAPLYDAVVESYWPDAASAAAAIVARPAELQRVCLPRIVDRERTVTLLTEDHRVIPV